MENQVIARPESQADMFELLSGMPWDAACTVIKAIMDGAPVRFEYVKALAQAAVLLGHCPISGRKIRPGKPTMSQWALERLYLDLRDANWAVARRWA